MVPTLVEQGYFSESLGRWLVPIGDYLDEIHHCLLLGKKMGGGALVERLIRKHVETTLISSSERVGAASASGFWNIRRGQGDSPRATVSSGNTMDEKSTSQPSVSTQQ